MLAIKLKEKLKIKVAKWGTPKKKDLKESNGKYFTYNATVHCTILLSKLINTDVRILGVGQTKVGNNFTLPTTV
jgi:hypothetical protein